MTLRNNQTVTGAVLGGLALLIGAAGMLLLVLPQRSQSDKLNTQISQAQASLSALQAPATPSGPAFHAADLFKLSEAMPNDTAMPGVLITLSQLARVSRIGVVSVTPQKPIQLDGYSAIPITLVLKGKYAGVTEFMYLLQKMVQQHGSALTVSGRLFVANQVQLASSDGRNVNATINLDAFQFGGTPVVPVGATGTTGATTTTTTTTTSG